jgi:hypothetical protein
LSPGRHAQSQTGRAKPVVLAGGVALLVVVGIVLLLVLGGDGVGVGAGGVETSQETPPFDFELTKVLAVPTRPEAVAAQLHGKAKPAAEDVAEVMTALYAGAFLDPEHWQNDDFDDVWSAFSTEAGAEAQASEDVLTAGSDAGTAFTPIEPDEGTLRVRVLLDQKDVPVSVVAIATFSATAAGSDGSTVLMQSTGQFVFERTHEAWQVVSFHVQRNDQRVEAATPSASGSPS